jgi:hypothetical protein
MQQGNVIQTQAVFVGIQRQVKYELSPADHNFIPPDRLALPALQSNPSIICGEIPVKHPTGDKIDVDAHT